MHREELVGIQTIWWVDYQLAVGFLTGSWKSNMDVWISNQLLALVGLDVMVSKATSAGFFTITILLTFTFS